MQKILEEVDKIINGERQDRYGNPEESFQIIADFWTIYLIHKYNLEWSLDAEDIAIMMSLFKHARMLGPNNKRDNMVDSIGYLALLADRILKERREE